MAREPSTSGGSLHLPKDIGVATSTASTIENWWNTIEAVNKRLALAGIHPNIEPDIVCPEITAEILLTDDVRVYTTAYSAQNRWNNYVTRLHGDVRAVLLQVENEMTDIAAAKRNYFRTTYTGKEKMSVLEMEDAISQDPHYRELRLMKQQLDQQRIKLDTWLEGLVNNTKIVSRQIELRKTEYGNGNREGNMPEAASGRPDRWERGHQKPVGG